MSGRGARQARMGSRRSTPPIHRPGSYESITEDVDAENQECCYSVQGCRQSQSEHQRKRARTKSADGKHAGDGCQVRNGRTCRCAESDLPRLSDRRGSLHVARAPEPPELAAASPIDRRESQHHIGKTESCIRPKVPEFVKYDAQGAGDCASSNRGQPPFGSQPPPHHASFINKTSHPPPTVACRRSSLAD